MNLYFSEASPNLKARDLLEAVLISDRTYFMTTYHAPEMGIKPGEYYVVEVRRVEVTSLEALENAAKVTG